MTSTIPFVATDYLKKNQKSLEPVFNTRTLKLDDDTKMKKAVINVLERAEQLKKTFKEGRRNDYIFYVATQLKKLGIPKEFAIATLDDLLSLSNFGEHIERFCRVYDNDIYEFGKYRNQINSVEAPQSYNDKDSDYNTPLFDDVILEKLPKFLRRVTQIPDGERESNILFLATNAMIGSILEGVTCIHDDKQFYTNLNLIVQAGFASGKGSAMNIVKIGASINQYFEEKNVKLIHQYNIDYARAVKMKHPKPDYPVLFKLIFPADTSSSGLKKQLHRYGGKGVMFDTELDTLNSVSGHKWGEELSNLLRKTFMNEAIKHVRANDEVDIKSPRLSVVLTGTPQSVRRFIPDIENGMFSRNIFYAFDSNAEFSKDAFSAKKWRQNQNKFESLADELLELYKKLEELVYLEKTIVFEWSDSHQEILVSKFDTWAKQHEQIFGKESKRLFFRLALITTRLATIFSVLRKNEQDGLLSILQDDSNEIVINCSNEDFEIALHVTDVIRQHNFFVYENLPDNGKAIYESYTSSSRLNELLIALPEEFKREDVLHLMDKISVGKRTFDNYLKKLLELGLIEKNNRRFGHYVKKDVAKL